MNLPLSALVCSISLAVPLSATDKSVAMDRSVDAPSPARAELLALVTRFRHAILVKDGDAMRGMFLSGGSGLRVLNPTSLAIARARNPEARQFDPCSYEEFAKRVETNPAALEETFDNVRIETDGTVGMVWFDHRFQGWQAEEPRGGDFAGGSRERLEDQRRVVFGDPGWQPLAVSTNNAHGPSKVTLDGHVPNRGTL